jgi:hypothetical protein
LQKKEFNRVATKVVDFLTQLERALPPPEGGHHLLMSDQSSSYEKGGRNSLMLRVIPADSQTFQTFFLDDSDFKKPTSELVKEIVFFTQQLTPAISQPAACTLVTPEPKS